MKTKTYFVFRIDIWDDSGNSIVEHVAGVDDFEVAEATYRAAVARWPRARMTLRQGALLKIGDTVWLRMSPINGTAGADKSHTSTRAVG
jgi:hypothetical protein